MIGIAGCLSDDCEVVYDHGIDSVFSVVPTAMSLNDALVNAAFNVEKTACNIARLLKINLWLNRIEMTGTVNLSTWAE